MSRSLQGLRMLVVEDEAMVAMLVEDLLLDFGCVVVDVVGTVEQGLAKVGEIAQDLDGAILDVNLGGALVFPVADLLAKKGVKFVFATGYGPKAVEDRYADRPVLSKPFRREALHDTLLAALA